ncbi:hypothetical protein TNCV_3999691 [Trichonephila clavipes]|nr:hypothetical protein TNCV_3999691 [Trichonephila clavipes]
MGRLLCSSISNSFHRASAAVAIADLALPRVHPEEACYVIPPTTKYPCPGLQGAAKQNFNKGGLPVVAFPLWPLGKLNGGPFSKKRHGYSPKVY